LSLGWLWALANNFSRRPPCDRSDLVGPVGLFFVRISSFVWS